MSTAALAEIRALQFTDLPRANALLLEFFKAKLPLAVRSVEIRVLAVSLNSVNGFVDTVKGKFFFKAHIESQVADREYYTTCLSRGDCFLGTLRTVRASATYRF